MVSRRKVDFAETRDDFWIKKPVRTGGQDCLCKHVVEVLFRNRDIALLAKVTIDFVFLTNTSDIAYAVKHANVKNGCWKTAFPAMVGQPSHELRENQHWSSSTMRGDHISCL